MPTYHIEVREAVRTKIATAWPECVLHGVLTDQESMSQDWDSLMAKDPPPLPLAIFRMLSGEERRYGVANRVENFRTEIFYIAHAKTTYDDITLKMETLQGVFVGAYLDPGQVITNPVIVEDPEQLEILYYFFNTQKPFRVSCLVMEIIAGKAGSLG